MRMIRAALFLVPIALGLPALAAGEEALNYRVRYDLAVPSVVHITVKFAAPTDAPR